jgi:hypothetical protein
MASAHRTLYSRDYWGSLSICLSIETAVEGDMDIFTGAPLHINGLDDHKSGKASISFDFVDTWHVSQSDEPFLLLTIC